MKIIDRLPYHEVTSYLSIGNELVEVLRYQIVVWVSLQECCFPAILDTGHSHNFTISERQLKRFAGIDLLPRIGEVAVNRLLLPQVEASVWIHGNKAGSRELSAEKLLLTMDEGITLYPDGAPGTPRLPLLGLRAITKNGLTLIVDGGRREVSIMQ